MRLGYIGEVHPEVSRAMDVKDRLYIAEIDLEIVNRIASYAYKFEEIGKYPPIERDLAVIVKEEVPVGDIIAQVKKAGGNMLREAKVFDIYSLIMVAIVVTLVGIVVYKLIAK